MMTSDDDPGSDPHPETAQKLSGLGEDGLIETIKKAAEKADPRVLKGIGDDAAVVKGSALKAMQGDEGEDAEQSILALVKALDEYVAYAFKAIEK